MTAITPERRSIDGATCTVWRDAPAWNGRRTAAVGAFSCPSAAAGSALLRDIAGRLREEGFAAVIGPMDGDTWHKYRVVSESDGSAPYFLEPVSGPHDLSAFLGVGFSAISSYVSARTTLDEAIGAPAPVVEGITIAAWDGQDAGRLIGGLFDLSRQAFAGNAFYKPIGRDAFLALYQPILPAIDPRLVFFAHAPGGGLAGFLFAIPDRLQGPKPATGIIKTYASGVRGVGHMLLDRCHRTMRDMGQTEAIHALMHVDNRSRDRSARHHGRVFRRYDLMGLELGDGAA
jgi:hypothetical protein